MQHLEKGNSVRGEVRETGLRFVVILTLNIGNVGSGAVLGQSHGARQWCRRRSGER